MSTRRTDWSFRLKEELKASWNAFFITLTYEPGREPIYIDENGEVFEVIQKREFQLFMKRFRDYQSKQTDIRIRYYAVGEYGTKNDRPHYHAIVFNVHAKTMKNLSKLWGEGFVHIGYVTDASIHYVTKYHVNRIYKHGYEDEFQPFSLMSKGLGKQYIVNNSKLHQETRRTYVINNGYKQRLPRYFKEKIFNEDERKAISKINQITQLKNDLTEVQRLQALGIKDPNLYIYESQLSQSKKVKNKRINENDLF